MDVVFKLQDEEFEWNEEKYAVNLAKHGVKFETAAEVFLDPFHQSGEASVIEENRNYIVGYAFSQKLLLVVYVERGVRNRIISARNITPTERKSYEQS